MMVCDVTLFFFISGDASPRVPAVRAPRRDSRDRKTEIFDRRALGFAWTCHGKKYMKSLKCLYDEHDHVPKYQTK